MWLLVSNKSILPDSLLRRFEDCRKLSVEEFVTAASSDTGIDDYRRGILVDVSVLNEELYRNLVPYKDSGVNIIFYKVNNATVPYYMSDEVTSFSTKNIKSIYGPDDNFGVKITYNDMTVVYIDTDTYNRNKLAIQYLDFFDVVKLYAYEVQNADKYGF